MKEDHISSYCCSSTIHTIPLSLVSLPPLSLVPLPSLFLVPLPPLSLVSLPPFSLVSLLCLLYPLSHDSQHLFVMLIKIGFYLPFFSFPVLIVFFPKCVKNLNKIFTITSSFFIILAAKFASLLAAWNSLPFLCSIFVLHFYLTWGICLCLCSGSFLKY